MKKCPKCGFLMRDKYCLKCGYIDERFVDEITKDTSSDMELLLKDDYQKIIHYNNSILIFIMGPLYLVYRGFILLGTIMFILDIFIRYYISTVLSYCLDTFMLGIQGEISPVIYFWFLIRLIYVLFLDVIVVKLSKEKIKIYKNSFPNKYKTFLELINVNNYFLVIIYIVLECLLWYYLF